MRQRSDLPSTGKILIEKLVEESAEFRKFIKKKWRLKTVNSDAISKRIAAEIWKETEKSANSAKYARELYEKYGPLKDYILHPQVQWLLTLSDELWREFRLFGNRPLPLVGSVMIIIMLTRAKQQFSTIIFAAAVLASLHPIVLAFASFIYLNIMHAKRYPKQYKSLNLLNLSDESECNPVNYSVEFCKEESDFDCLVIGSNLAGLISASILSKVGKRVLVLERDDHVCGKEYAQSADGNFEFEIESPCVGNVAHYSMLLNLISDNTGGGLKWYDVGLSHRSMKVHKIVQVGTKGGTVVHSTGSFTTQEYLCSQFPEERSKIENFFNAISSILRSNALYIYYNTRTFASSVANRILQIYGDSFSKIAEKPANNLLEKISDSTSLRSALYSLATNENISAEEMSAGSYIAELCRSLNGLSYPKGGLKAVMNSIIPSIFNSGGKIFTKVPISSIYIEDGLARGVVLNNERLIRVKPGGCVISTVGAIETFDTLLSSEDKKKYGSYPAGFEKLTEAKPKIHLCVGLNGNWSDDLDCTSCDFFHVRDENASLPDEHYSDGESEWLKISFSTAKDPSKWWSQTTSCVVSQEIPAKLLTKIDRENEPIRYEVAASEKLEEVRLKMLKKLHNVYPLTNGNEEVMVFKVDNRVGLSNTTDRFCATGLRVPTHIPKLFLGGSDLTTNDMAGKIDAGFIVANAVLGYTPFDLLALNRGLAQDLQNIPRKK